MKSQMKWGVWAAGALALSACSTEASSADDEDAGVEQFSINVEADRSRILEEEQDLQEQQKSVEEKRAELEDAQKKIAEKLASLKKSDRKQRAALEAEQAKLAEQASSMEARLTRFERERQRLERQKDQLLNKSTSDVNALQRRVQQQSQQISALESSLSRTSQKLNELEQIVKSLESRGMSTRTVVVERPRGASSKKVDKGDVDAAKKSFRRALRNREFLLSDLSAAARRSLSDAEAATQEKDYEQALVHYQAVLDSVNNTHVDVEFIDAKTKRADQLVRAGSIPSQKVNPILRDLGEAVADGKYVEANMHLNKVFRLAQRN